MSNTRDKQKAKGDKVEQQFYDAEDSAAHDEAEQKDESFKRGGTIRKLKAKRKRGGAARRGLKAHGQRARPRADKPRRARGGAARHSPLTKAADTEGRPGGDYDGKPTTREDD
jgi:hypothetical protein